MAKLINGNGNPAVYANEDSDWFAAIMGNQTSITAIGEQFRADQADANTIEVFDGVIITKEGRRIQLDANQVDLFEIPTGTQGQTNYYIIGYHLYTDTDSNQFCEVFVQLMESASDTIPEDTFRGGADDVYISLYRVTQDGLNIDSIDLLLPTISTISKINADLCNTLKGSQIGAGSNTVSIVNATKILCVVKKSNVVICTKYIPTAILSANDVIPLGANIQVFGESVVDSSTAGGAVLRSDQSFGWWSVKDESGTVVTAIRINADSVSKAGNAKLYAGLSSAVDVNVTYNGTDSYTITSVAGVDVYLYA